MPVTSAFQLDWIHLRTGLTNKFWAGFSFQFSVHRNEWPKERPYGHWKLKTENSKRDVTQILAKSRAAAGWINDVYRTYNTFSGSSPWIWTWSRGLWIKSKVPGFSGLKTLDSVFSPEKSPQQAFLSKTENWNLKTLDSVFSFQCTVTSGLRPVATVTQNRKPKTRWKPGGRYIFHLKKSVFGFVKYGVLRYPKPKTQNSSCRFSQNPLGEWEILDSWCCRDV